MVSTLKVQVTVGTPEVTCLNGKNMGKCLPQMDNTLGCSTFNQHSTAQPALLGLTSLEKCSQNVRGMVSESRQGVKFFFFFFS